MRFDVIGSACRFERMKQKIQCFIKSSSISDDAKMQRMKAPYVHKKMELGSV